MSAITQDCRTLLQTQLDTQLGVVRKYDGWDVHGTSYATIGTPTWNLVVPDAPDQAYGVQAITFPVYVYQFVDGSAEKSMEYQDANFHKVLAALGSDRTLGNASKVRSSEVVGEVTGEVYRTEAGQAVSVLLFNVRVVPVPNVA